jgi:hypothetical protein
VFIVAFNMKRKLVLLYLIRVLIKYRISNKIYKNRKKRLISSNHYLYKIRLNNQWLLIKKAIMIYKRLLVKLINQMIKINYKIIKHHKTGKRMLCKSIHSLAKKRKYARNVVK